MLATRRLLAFAATLVLVGIALCASDNAGLGAFVNLSGLLLTVYAIHRFGRSGPDEPLFG